MKTKIEKILKSGLVPYLVGQRGEGKTSFIRDLGKEMKKEVFILNLSAIESTDFTGLPSIESGLTKYSKPEFLNFNGIIFLDEIDRVRDNAVKSCLLSLVLDRKINGHELNKETLLISAGNGQADGYDTAEMDLALSDRLVLIPFSYSIEEKIDYLRKNYPDNKFISFLSVKPEIFKEFSSRRIEAWLKSDDKDLDILDLFLSKEVSRLYRNFLENSLYSLEDIKTGRYDFTQLSTISKSSLVLDLIESFYTLKEKTHCLNLNDFISKLRPEEKAVYFSGLKKLCLKNPDEFHGQAKKLNLAGFFEGQKDFLAELSKI